MSRYNNFCAWGMKDWKVCIFTNYFFKIVSLSTILFHLYNKCIKFFGNKNICWVSLFGSLMKLSDSPTSDLLESCFYHCGRVLNFTPSGTSLDTYYSFISWILLELILDMSQVPHRKETPCLVSNKKRRSL